MWGRPTKVHNDAGIPCALTDASPFPFSVKASSLSRLEDDSLECSRDSSTHILPKHEHLGYAAHIELRQCIDAASISLKLDRSDFHLAQPQPSSLPVHAPGLFALMLPTAPFLL